MNTLSYKLDFNDRKSYLYAHISGEDSFAAGLSYWNEIADEIKKHGSKKLLVHEDLTGEVTETEMHDIIMDLASSILMDVKLAVVDENLNDKAINALGQSLAIDAGGHVMIFHSLDAAQRWLED